MNRTKKTLLALAGITMLLLAVWWNAPQAALSAEDLKFEQMRRESSWGAGLRAFKAHLPTGVTLPVWTHTLGNRLFNHWNVRYQELQKSGYFTNTVVVVTNWPPGKLSPEQQRVELNRRIQSALGRNFFFSFGNSTDPCALMCRTNELLKIQEAVNRP
jgi:hypothetical protein